MARPRRRNRTSVSLFPFLSVLACVIGTLVLLITASATSQVAAGGIDFERYEHLEQQIEENRRRLAELSGLAEELLQLESSLADARRRSETLERESAAVQQALARHAPLRETLRQDQLELRGLEAERLVLARAREAREKELAERKRVLSDAKIRLEPTGSGYGLDPRFVECRPEGIVYYEGLERRPVPVATHQIAASASYRRFLRAAVFQTNTTVIFLIRRGGVDACEWARGVARQHRLRNGEVPLVGDGPIDFSAVDGA
jgi:Skp family chaperone for outer membrane proteins